jgi:hypothetical protein
LETPITLALQVMHCSGRTIDADSHLTHLKGSETGCNGLVDHPAIGTDRNPESTTSGVSDQLKNIRPQERLATQEVDAENPNVCKLGDQARRLSSRKLVSVVIGRGRR